SEAGSAFDHEDTWLDHGGLAGAHFDALPELRAERHIVDAGRDLDGWPERVHRFDLLVETRTDQLSLLASRCVEDLVTIPVGTFDLKLAHRRAWQCHDDLGLLRRHRLAGRLAQRGGKLARSAGVRIGAARHGGDALQLAARRGIDTETDRVH